MKKMLYTSLWSLFIVYILGFVVTAYTFYDFHEEQEHLNYEFVNQMNMFTIAVDTGRHIEKIQSELLKNALFGECDLKRTKEDIESALTNIEALRFGGTVLVPFADSSERPVTYHKEKDELSDTLLANTYNTLTKLDHLLPAEDTATITAFLHSNKNLFSDIDKETKNLLSNAKRASDYIENKLITMKEERLVIAEISFFLIISIVTAITFFILIQIKKLNAKLEKTTEEARQNEEKAKRANAFKSRFLANMSHEIRTPLNAMLGFISVLKERERDKESEAYLDIIDKSGKSLLYIINDILDISKIESGKLEIHKEDISIRDELTHCYTLFEQKAKQKGIKFTLHLSDNIPEAAQCDSLRLKQIVSNLLSNAIKFTPMDGSIALSATFDSGQNILRIEVKDSGIGISEDAKERIFHSFEQENASTTKEYGGTGLGLAISKRLLELIGGGLRVESEKDKGSRFFVEIPYTKGEITNVKHDSCCAPASCSKCYEGKVLVVEDVKPNRELMKVFLRSFDIEPSFAHDGLEAINLCLQDDFDLIFMDENMPNMSGVNASIEMLRQKPDLNIVALSANATNEFKEKAKKAGMRDVIFKPFKKETIQIMLEKYLIAKPFTVQSPPEEIGQNNTSGKPYDEAKVAERLGLDAQGFKEILQSFFESVDAELEHLKKAVKHKNSEKTKYYAHAIKGSALNLGMEALSTVARDIELSSEKSDKKELEKKLSALEKAYKAVKRDADRAKALIFNENSV